jgi:TRAP-type C4-dicarboxylate transport system permease small subunit
MQTGEILIPLFVLLFWYCAAIAFSFYKWGREAKGSRRGYITFIICGGLLAISRSWAYWYLSYRMRTHTVTEGLRPLELLLLPEAWFVGLVQLDSLGAWLSLMYAALIVGSFLWAFPLVLFFARRRLP